jgi:CHAT domain
MPGQPADEGDQFLPLVFSRDQQPAEDPLVPATETPQAPEQPSVSGLPHGEPKKFTGWSARLPQTLPPGQAAIVISGVGGDSAQQHFNFQLLSCCMEPFPHSDANFGQIDLDVSTSFERGKPPPAEFLIKMSNWSEGQETLTGWLNACRREHRDDLELLIWDVNTGVKIPWELLRLPPDRSANLPQGYLGALVTVARWPGEGVDPERAGRMAEPVPVRGSGDVLAHFAAGLETDRDMLRGFFGELEEEDPVNLLALLKRLEGEPGALALLYIACHGRFSDVPGKCRLDNLDLERATKFFERDLPRLIARPTLAFLNACDTGVSGINTSTNEYNDGALRGWANFFLSRGAAGVLATAGKVGKDQARELATDLFQMLRAGQGLSVAQALKLLRADRARELEAKERAVIEQEYERQWRLDAMSPEASAAARAASDQAAKVKAVKDAGEMMTLLQPFLYVYFHLPDLWTLPADRADPAETGELTGAGG